jgi:hypothetical protein
MKLVRYDDPVDGVSVDLHPLLTVVSGWSPAARVRFLQIMGALTTGGPLTVTGELEVHGVRLSLSQATLELLELTADLSVVLRAAEVPGGGPRPGPEIDDTALRPELERSIEAEQLASRQVAAAHAAIHEAERALADVVNRRASVALRLDQALSSVDTLAESNLRAATAELADLQRRANDQALLARAARRAELQRRLSDLGVEEDSARQTLERLPLTADGGTISAALNHLLAVVDSAPVRNDAALALADELEAALRAVSTDRHRASGGRSQLLELTARRDAAYDAMVAAEKLLRSPHLDPALVEELERTHDEIFELEGRTSRLSAARLRRRVTELIDRERRLLAEFGFDTWASYVMGVSSVAAESERLRRYDVAKATYDFAEDELAIAATAPSPEASDGSALERLVGELRERAAVLLGRSPGADPVTELREQSVTAGSLVGSFDQALIGLRDALRNAGASPGDDQTMESMIQAANRWLVGAAERSAQRASLELTLARVSPQIAALHDEMTSLTATIDVDVALPDADPQVSAARARIAVAEAAIARQRETIEMIASLRGEEHHLAGLEADLAESVANARRGADAAETQLRNAVAAVAVVVEQRRLAEAEREAQRLAEQRAASATVDSEAVEWYVLARLAAQRSVMFVGSMPFVIDDALARWTVAEMRPVYDRLARMSEVIQIVLVSDDPDVGIWAESLGPERARVIGFARGTTF